MTRSGVKTTEFWLTLVKGMVGPLLAILVASGTLTPDSVSEDEVVGHIDTIVGGVMALVALFMSGRAVQTYTEARTAVKQLEIQASVATAEGGESAIGFHADMEEEDDDEDDSDESDADADGTGIRLGY